jgi:hypothetical protein
MAPKLKTSFTLSEEEVIQLDQIVVAYKYADPQANTSGSSVVGELIRDKYVTLKRIVPIRENKKTIGWAAYYGEHFVGQWDGAASKPQAERALDAFVYQELSK